jgi:hypothetical protein
MNTQAVCRRGRVTILEKEAIAQDTEEALKKKEMEAEERRKQSHDLVAESIRRELAESKSQVAIWQNTLMDSMCRGERGDYS